MELDRGYTNSSLWTSYMATIFLGMCHTFTYQNDVDNDESTNMFLLDPDLNYRILIHDPKYYHVLAKSLFPRIWLEYNRKIIEGGTFNYLEISVTEHQLLNRPEQPCEEAEDYDFLKCVKTSQARRVGCRPPWDSWSPDTIPLCQTMDQLWEYDGLDFRLKHVEQKIILNYTGCQPPCKYKVCVDPEYSDQ